MNGALPVPVAAILCVLAASILGAGGQFLFKLAAARGGGAPLGFLWTPWAVLGLASYIAVMMLFSYAFQRGGTVAVLYPIYATTFIWAAIMSWLFYGHAIRPIHLLGMALLLAGIVCMSAGKVTPS
jgi:multidrug transporter EmrE-like cation transporter